MDKPTKPSKLKTLRPWLTVPEAARYLGLTFKDEVTEAEVLRFALDGELKLSVRFVNPTLASLYGPEQEARDTALAPIRAKALAARETGTPPPRMKRLAPVTEKHFSLQGGPWDLPMKGGELLDVEHRYQQLTGGPAVKTQLDSFDGTYVDGDNGERFRLYRKEVQEIPADLQTGPRRRGTHYILLTRLPEDSFLVLRREVLEEFVQRVSGTNNERPLGTRERDTLLAIIWTLLNSSGNDIKHLSKTAEAIATESQGLGVSVSVRTVFDHLNQAAVLAGRR